METGSWQVHPRTREKGTEEMKRLLGRVAAAALIVAGALGVVGGGVAALTTNSGNAHVAVECPPEKEHC